MIQLEPKKTALVFIDLQNDFLHPEGAYGRAGQTSESISKLIDTIDPVLKNFRDNDAYVISTQFTLIPGRGGEPLIDPHLKALRPFLKKGDFCPGEFGHDLIAKLKPADFYIEKVAYSAFYQTRLEFILRKMGIENLVFSGIVTNGGVASTARDAHTRGFKTFVLSDGTAAFKPEVHDTSISALGALVQIPSCEEMASASIWSS